MNEQTDWKTRYYTLLEENKKQVILAYLLIVIRKNYTAS